MGTATPFDHLFLLQLPPPWQSIALATPSVPPGVREALALAARPGELAYALLIDGGASELQATEPQQAELRVIHYGRTASRALGYERREYAVFPGETANAIADILRWGETRLGRELTGEPARDMLVCTHGERDRCCGRFGEGAFRYLREVHAGTQLRVWRVSHFGGHRFAPTLIDLPDGRCWGRLSQPAIDRIVLRSGEPAELESSYRGWCALPSEAQAAERDLFFEYGWRWRDASVEAELSQPGREGAVSAKGGLVAAKRGMRVRFSYCLKERTLEGHCLEGLGRQTRNAQLEPVLVSAGPPSCGAEPASVIRYSCSWQHVDAGALSTK